MRWHRYSHAPPLIKGCLQLRGLLTSVHSPRHIDPTADLSLDIGLEIERVQNLNVDISSTQTTPFIMLLHYYLGENTA